MHGGWSRSSLLEVDEVYPKRISKCLALYVCNPRRARRHNSEATVWPTTAEDKKCRLFISTLGLTEQAAAKLRSLCLHELSGRRTSKQDCSRTLSLVVYWDCLCAVQTAPTSRCSVPELVRCHVMCFVVSFSVETVDLSINAGSQSLLHHRCLLPSIQMRSDEARCSSYKLCLL